MAAPRFPHGLMFHRFHAEGSPPLGQGSVSSRQLEKIIEFYGPRNILGPDEWLSRLQGGTLRGRDVCITLDDGLRSQYDVCLPVLERYGLRAFWFVFSSVFEGGMERGEIYNRFATTSFLSFSEFCAAFLARCSPRVLSRLDSPRFALYDRKMRAQAPFFSMNDVKFRFIRNELPQEEFAGIVDPMIKDKGLTTTKIARNLWLTNAQLKALSSKGHVIGMHSYDHPFQLARLTPREQAAQYERNYQHIRRVCGEGPRSMSHPLNSYNRETLKILTRQGIVCGFRSLMAPPPGKKVNPSPLEIAREDPTNVLSML